MNTVLIYNLANSLGFSTVGIGTFTVGFYRLGNCWELSYFTTDPHSFTTVDFRIFFPVVNDIHCHYLHVDGLHCECPALLVAAFLYNCYT